MRQKPDSPKYSVTATISAEDEVLSSGRRRWAIAAISLGSVLTVMDGTIATVALPTIASNLHIAGSSAILVVSIYQMVLVMALLPCAGLGDRIGIKRFYQYGQVLFVCATALCFFAHSLLFLLIVRALQAVGAAAVLSVTAAMIRSIYPVQRLGRGLGVNSLVSSVSAALAPTVGGLVIGVAPWPWIFAIAVPFGVVSLWIGWRALPDLPPIEGRYDLRGAVLNAATFGLLLAGMENVSAAGPAIASMTLAVLGTISAVWFVRHELAEPRPILPLDLLEQPVMALSIFGSFLVFTGNMLLGLSLPFRLEHHFGFTPGAVGAVLTVSPLVMIVFMPLAGMLSDKLHAAVQSGIGMAVTIAGLLLLVFLPAHPTILDLAWRMAPSGIGLALFVTSNSRMVIRLAPRDRATAAGGLISTTRLVGQTAGASIVAMLLGLGVGSTNLPLLIAVAVSAIAGLLGISRVALQAFKMRRATHLPYVEP